MRNRGPRAGWALAVFALAWATSAEAGETVTYSYDSLGRLVRVERSGINNGVNAAYCYDAADNRTLVTTNRAAAPQCPVSAPPPPSPPPPPPPPPPPGGAA